MMSTPEKLSALRAAMEASHIDAWIIPSSDPHESEYSSDHWAGREWLSGFTGSAGTVVVLKDKAALWTDGRYFLQASQELENSGIELMRDGMPEVPAIPDWLTSSLSKGSVVGFDGKVMNHHQTEKLLAAFTDKAITIEVEKDLLNSVWTDRPAMPATSVFLHDDSIAGKTREEKMAEVRQGMAKKGASHLLITMLDDIAWLLNLRASDIECNPVFLSYILLTDTQVKLYVNNSRIEADALQALKASGIELLPYDAIADDIRSLDSDTRLLMNPASTNQWLVNALPESVKVIKGASPTLLLKAIKNDVEIERMGDCHRRDGAAMVRFMRWLENNIPGGNVTELSLDEFLQSSRAQAPEFKGPSFPTIAGYASNGAIIHYRADEQSSLNVEPKGLLLVDSGAQYPDGTTDITRTFACGPMTEEEQKDYTLVLKAHINLAKARFLKGTRGMQLDMLARQPVWEAGQNYNHGTGHGIGYFLNVHEGPHSVSPKWIDQPLQVGMLLTNEPGMYRNGKHGVRIENIMRVAEDITTEFGEFYKLVPMTLAPMDTRPIVREMLTQSEIDWLNGYHSKVREELSPLLSGDDLDWLNKATQTF
ncbi:hypothetical protein GZ77_22975 [Endozoicomonas montiporae]|uniref:Peptidase M24 n=2 Tax=Endozoicomonas montiporae TaxID=1027273 RepID=A0A081N0J4_9GAMM|nr:aminopeptidase P family protein [Endozoicomonas montiporae]AMO54429.1 Xaa-Pro aminopeptidase [Endozoicomonas montiporae CL-33]KEQ11967.1 hypothetical protein GZ77_22975 [Endozoicomonas montiporae]